MLRQMTILVTVFIATNILVAGDKIFEIDDIGYEQIYYGGFVVNDDKTLTIEAVGAGGDKNIRRVNSSHLDKFNMFAYAWILDSDSREMVWRMSIDNTDKDGWSEWNRSFEGKVKLKAGEYEVYFSAIEPSFFSLNGGLITVGKVFKRIFSDADQWDDDASKWKIKISGVDEVYDQKTTKKYLEKRKESSIMHIYGARDSKRENRGFTLTEPINVSIYALGEGYKSEIFDYAWILNASTREQVWKMRETDTDYAGGAEKNRVVHEQLKLDAGDYLVYYKLDGSHSGEEWNSNPPYDPFYWGITISAIGKDFDPSTVKKYSETKVKPVVSIDRVGDYAYKEAGLKLLKPSKVRILAIGEGRDGEMYDYAWITNAKDGETVWKMRYNRTNHAGGASKNRVFDGVIDMDAGEYIVYYQSDDSHSYEDWNMAAPDDPEMWGISIFAVGNASDMENLNLSRRRKDNILVKLIRIGDDEHVRKQFKLEKETRIRIYCLGEGDYDEMYDYGWIKDEDNDDLIWKMRYRRTEHAGGAKKNRQVDTIITLDPGTYSVHYRSDDSHSYYDWNLRAPHDKQNWGITIYNLSD